MPKRFVYNGPLQRDFVENPYQWSAYIGGLGSGKTWAGIARGLAFSQQPTPPGNFQPPKGLVGAVNYPVLNDVVIPEFFKLIEGTDLLKDYRRSEKLATLKNGAEIRFRSLDKPDQIRGLEVTWFFFDEGRHLTRSAWDVLVGRLRQPGYTGRRAGWVCSTPNGYDWMFHLFHKDGEFYLGRDIEVQPDHGDGIWYNAPTSANAVNLDEDYLNNLKAQYSGKFLRQEFYGEFVGLIQGSVFPEWDPQEFAVKPIAYDSDLPLYSAWDFGIGDPGVVLFCQIVPHEYKDPADLSRPSVWVDQLHILDYLEQPDTNAEGWADVFKEASYLRFEKLPDENWGDPAGKARAHGSGTSVIEDLEAQDVHVIPAPKKAPDYGIRILRNMMEGKRVWVDSEHGSRVGTAFAAHKWNIGPDGRRNGKEPVHDWTSHFGAAARYLAAGKLSFFNRISREKDIPRKPPPGSVGDVTNSLLNTRPGKWLGPHSRGPKRWRPAAPIGG